MTNWSHCGCSDDGSKWLWLNQRNGAKKVRVWVKYLSNHWFKETINRISNMNSINVGDTMAMAVTFLYYFKQKFDLFPFFHKFRQKKIFTLWYIQ